MRHSYLFLDLPRYRLSSLFLIYSMSLSWYYPSSRLYPPRLVPHIQSAILCIMYSSWTISRTIPQCCLIAPPTLCGSTPYTNSVQLVPLHLDLAVCERLDIFLRMILLANSCGVAMASHMYSHLDVVRQCHTDGHGTDHPRFLSIQRFQFLTFPKQQEQKNRTARQTDRTDTSI